MYLDEPDVLALDLVYYHGEEYTPLYHAEVKHEIIRSTRKDDILWINRESRKQARKLLTSVASYGNQTEACPSMHNQTTDFLWVTNYDRIYVRMDFPEEPWEDAQRLAVNSLYWYTHWSESIEGALQEFGVYPLRR